LPPRRNPAPTPAPQLTNALMQMREAVESMLDEKKDDEPWG
jgi:hypothetical protein